MKVDHAKLVWNNEDIIKTGLLDNNNLRFPLNYQSTFIRFCTPKSTIYVILAYNTPGMVYHTNMYDLWTKKASNIPDDSIESFYQVYLAKVNNPLMKNPRF